ncbi:SDR family NAD(P)-dependent oxidoreductase [Microbacterium sp.]|uniref:SDR family NAD(P)-dependent oxidoreductase n=1 Tax=Microbacterium sp. TaxID=51671 RepID=UPI003F97D3B7
MTAPAHRFEGLTVAVSGGSSGIGLATASVFEESGADVFALDLVPSATRQSGQHVSCDVRSRSAVAEAASAIQASSTGIDILINCAGVGAVGTVSSNDDAEWQRVLDINVAGIARTTSAFLDQLRRSAHAAIVNVSSVVATTGVPNRALYSASKGAVSALTLAMAADHLGDGIRVNAVAPGTTDTPWVKRLVDAAAEPVEAARQLRARQPIGRLVTAEEVASVIAHLADPDSAATTGAIVAIDGGFSSLRLPA